VFSNYFTLEFTSPDIKGINKYHLTFTPEIPDNSTKLARSVISKAKDALKEKIGFYMYWGTCIYSYKAETELPAFESEVDGAKYQLKLEWV
jgi:hypothetical protein